MSALHAEIRVMGSNQITSNNCNLTVLFAEEGFAAFYQSIDENELIAMLNKKGYQNIEFEYYYENSSGYSDLKLSLTSNVGREPYAPVIYSCVLGGITYKQGEPVSSVRVYERYIFRGKRKCYRQIPVLVENLPQCNISR